MACAVKKKAGWKLDLSFHFLFPWGGFGTEGAQVSLPGWAAAGSPASGAGRVESGCACVSCAGKAPEGFVWSGCVGTTLSHQADSKFKCLAESKHCSLDAVHYSSDFISSNTLFLQQPFT